METPEEREMLMRQAGLSTAMDQQAQQAAAAQYLVEEQEKGLAEAQLEVETTLKNLYYRLRQDVFKIDKNGKIEWEPLKDLRKRRLTDDGVERIMELMSFYINKENLLSNFSEEQINRIMLTFRLALSGNILMRYKIYFREPTFDECKELLMERVEEQTKVKVFAQEIVGIKSDKKKIKESLLANVEERIEYEIKKIREEKLKQNLSEFELLFEQLSQMILATLNRAWKGEERGSLRRRTSIAEIIGTPAHQQQMPKERGGLFRWRRG